MIDQELDLRASMLRMELAQITLAPDDKSINQMKEEAIMRHFSTVEEIARMKALAEEIYAVGQTPEECILAAAEAKGWGEITKITLLEAGDEKFTWGRRFYANGTSMKAAGWEVPGGLVMTWWK
jgi:hypothetical protein